MKINRALKSFTAMALSAILAFGAQEQRRRQRIRITRRLLNFLKQSLTVQLLFPARTERVSLQPEGAAERYIMLQI